MHISKEKFMSGTSGEVNIYAYFNSTRGAIHNESMFDFPAEGTRAPWSVARTLAIVLACMGIVANMASLVAILHVSGAYSANMRLVISLLLSDLFVSVTILVFVINNALFPFFLAEDYGAKLCSYTILRALVMMGHTISLFNLVVLALDHFLAINKPLRYIYIFTGRRVTLVIVCLWILAAFCGFSYLILPAPYYSYCQGKELVNFCEAGYCSKYETDYLLFPLAHVCFIIMCVFYSRVFHTIYQYQKMTGRHQRHMKRNIKGLITTLFILGTFLFCWLPHCIFEAYVLVKMLLDHMGAMRQLQLLLRVDYYLYSLWLVNSICDPIIYAVRMREVKTGYYNMAKCHLFRRMCGGSSQLMNPASSAFYHRSLSNTTGCELIETNTLLSPKTNSTMSLNTSAAK